VRIRILSQSDVRQAITMKQAVEAVKSGFAQLSAGQAEVPLRSVLPVPAADGVTLMMPAFLSVTGELGAKIVSVFPRNLGRGLPTIHAVVVLVDSQTGQPIALLDGTYLTALRTGAVSGAATDLLARPDADVVAVFGAGAQGRTQLEAVCAVRDVSRALVVDLNVDAANRFVQDMRESPAAPPDLRVAHSAAEAASEAHIICTATTSSTPVFSASDVRPGTHINAVGAFTPEMQEVDVAGLGKACIVVDSREACLAEAGDLIIPLRTERIPLPAEWLELGELVAGTKQGRGSREEITYFKSVGNAVQDVSVGGAVLEVAERLGLGTIVEL
jgi:ornithine cyclodeaminase/alanine dehydrogenase-like protein (mu-crystallin family)